jgi:hypothetical protein
MDPRHASVTRRGSRAYASIRTAFASRNERFAAHGRHGGATVDPAHARRGADPRHDGSHS